MEKLDDMITFKNMYKDSFEKNPLCDLSKPEVKLSIVSSIIFTISMILLVTNNDVASLTEVIKNLLQCIGAGLISMLGFIISGLAIASSTISNKMAYNIDKQGKFKKILSILFSFYYIGKVIGFLIIIYFICYIFISIEVPINLYLYYIIGIFLSYGFFFTIFYSVSLLETCLNLFILGYKYWRNSEVKENYSLLEQFNSARIDAIVNILYKNELINNKEEFIDEVKHIVNDNYEENLKEILSKTIEEYYE